MDNTNTNIVTTIDTNDYLEKKKEEIGNTSAITNHGMCNKNRSFQFETRSTEMGPAFYRAGIVKNTVINAIKYDIRDEENIRNFMSPQYPACEYPNFQQMRMINYLDLKKVMRYLNEETRKTPIFPRNKIITLNPEDYNIHDANAKERRYRVNVDIAFPYFTDTNKRGIELICYKLGKAEFTATGSKNALVRDLRLYLMVLMGRSLGFEEIKASYYYLSKNGDSGNWSKCPQSFFGGGGNIISMTDTYTGQKNHLDEEMYPKLQVLVAGLSEDEQCKEDCEYCDKYDICKFSLPPRVLVDDVVEASDVTTNTKPVITLSPEQKTAVEFHEGVLRINAGAGAGKTMVVAKHIEFLLSIGVLPEEICCITFTNAGAKEMKHRAERYSKRDLTGMQISTFNSFLNDIVIDAYKELGFNRPPKVISDVEKFRIIADILNKNPIYEWQDGSFMKFTSTKGWGAEKGALRIVADIFAAIKKLGGNSSLVTCRDVRDIYKDCVINDLIITRIISLYSEYEKTMVNKGLIDFDDQELLAFKLFNQDPDYLKNHYKFRHLIVDEFQDSSEGNIQLIRILKGLPTFESLVVVGDDAQAIFGFRNTTPEYIIHFENYIGCTVQDVFLQENHRSTPEICDFANKLIDMNIDKIDKKLIATRPSGMPVIVNGFLKQADEDEYIIKGIQHHIENGVNPHDMAIITYTKTELRRFADKLTALGIPSMFAAPEPKMENSRIRAILAFARVLNNRTNTKDALIAANALAKGTIMDNSEDEIKKEVAGVLFRAKAIDDAETLAEKKAIFLAYIDDIMDEDEAVENFKDGFANKDFDEIIEYCMDFTTYGEAEEFRRICEYPGVVLITAHSSKGLEYPIVYNSVTKYQKTDIKTRTASEEVRRLLFVSATRARDELYITGMFANGVKGARQENIYLANAYSAVNKPYTFTMDMLDKSGWKR